MRDFWSTRDDGMFGVTASRRHGNTETSISRSLLQLPLSLSLLFLLIGYSVQVWRDASQPVVTCCHFTDVTPSELVLELDPPSRQLASLELLTLFTPPSPPPLNTPHDAAKDTHVCVCVFSLHSLLHTILLFLLLCRSLSVPPLLSQSVCLPVLA